MFRIGTIVLTIPILLTAVAHGPGRGISLIPPGEWWTTPIAILEIIGLGTLLVGASLIKNPRASMLLLTIGLICRALFEIRISLLKALWPFESLNGLSVAWLAFYYLGAFLLPALLWCDLRRKLQIGVERAESTTEHPDALTPKNEDDQAAAAVE